MRERPARPPEEGPISGLFLELAPDGQPPEGPFPAPPTPSGDLPAFDPCSDVPPYDTEISECRHPLAYAPLPGPSVVFLRRLEREPSQQKIRDVLRSMLPWSIDALPKEDRDGWLEKAREKAVSETEPVVHVSQIVVCGDRAVCSPRPPSDGVRSYLSAWLGVEVSSDPVLWSRSRDGQPLLLAALEEQIRLEREGLSLADQVFKVEEATLSHGRSTIRGPVKKLWGSFDSLIRSPGADPTVDSAVIRVLVANGQCKLHVGSEGLRKAEIPNSRGGLPRDRVSRRFRDLDRVVGVARKELLEALARSEG